MGRKNDLISRQNITDAMERWLYDSKDNRTVREVVYELPSAEPERKGKWTYRNGEPATIGKSYSVICSECKEWSEYCTNFCPNCGCDMRG